MGAATFLPALLVGGGLGGAVYAVLGRGRSRTEDLAGVLDLPFGDQDVPVTAVSERPNSLFAGPSVGIANVASVLVGRFDQRGSLQFQLEKARLPVKAGEYVVLAAAGTLALAAVLMGLTGTYVFGVIALALGALVSKALPGFLIGRRQKAFEAQLPDAISLIAGSLAAGHTFLRAIQMMCEEAAPPLSEEFARVVQETRLGDSVVDALERMAQRVELKDMEWIVQAIRIQQTVGGKLSDLLYSLADFIRAREEIQREVRVLTAEGRISAYILGALPLVVMLVIQVSNPIYMKPLFQGWGLWVLAGTGVSIVSGVAIILKMAKIEV